MSGLKDEVGSSVIEALKRHLRPVARRETLSAMLIVAMVIAGCVLAGWSVSVYADAGPQSMSPSDINTPADSPPQLLQGACLAAAAAPSARRRAAGRVRLAGLRQLRRT